MAATLVPRAFFQDSSDWLHARQLQVYFLFLAVFLLNTRIGLRVKRRQLSAALYALSYSSDVLVVTFVGDNNAIFGYDYRYII